MEFLKQKIINATSDNIGLYAIEKQVEKFNRGMVTEYTFMLKDNKSITVRDIGYVNPKTIDTWKYFNHYFKIFFDSIYLEVTQK